MKHFNGGASNTSLGISGLVADLLPQRPGFTSRPVHVTDEVAMGQVFLRVLCFSSCHYHSTVAPYSSVTASCAIALTKQHILIPSVISGGIYLSITFQAVCMGLIHT
jgi:hypothetical protein